MKEEEGKPDAEVFTKGCITLVGVGGHIEHARVGAVHADTSLTQARAQAYVDRILAHGRDDPKIRFSIIGLLPEGKTGMRDKIVGFFVKALENRGHTIHPDDIVRLHSEHGGFMTRIRPRGEITVFVHAEKNQ